MSKRKKAIEMYTMRYVANHPDVVKRRSQLTLFGSPLYRGSHYNGVEIRKNMQASIRKKIQRGHIS